MKLAVLLAAWLVSSAAAERAIATGRPVVIVAYSLGSVVAYQYLQRRIPQPSDRQVDLVTIGSPLGVPGLRALLGLETDSLAMPPSVRSWRNIRDPNDPLSGPVADSSDRRGIMDVATKGSGTGDAHMIEHYLRDPATAQAVGTLLNPITTVRP